VEAAAAADPRSAAEAEDGEGDPLGEAILEGSFSR